jgi:hypothetical protein
MKKGYLILLGSVSFVLLLFISKIFDVGLCVATSNLLSALFSGYSESLAFKADGNELLLIDRLAVTSHRGIEYMGSVHRTDFYSHLILPSLLFTYLSFVLYILKTRWNYSLLFLSAGLVFMLAKLLLPYAIDMNAAYTLVGEQFVRDIPISYYQKLLISANDILNGYGAIGSRLLLPLVAFVLLINPELTDKLSENNKNEKGYPQRA